MKLKRCVHRAWARIVLARNVAAAVVLVGVLFGVPSLWAHHGLAQFDTKHPLKLEGTVTRFEWINPHAYIYADVRDEKGKLTNWKFELGSLGMLTRFGGWSRDTLKRGDQIMVDGFPAKDGSPYMSLITVQLSNGKVLSAAP
ncbi:MAG: hypothetical protein DMG40_14120 [Acidobacteria bacterium]|nr:MAG: hypothetical protein DMG40_14120 [Acidobacteriota bacterium]